VFFGGDLGVAYLGTQGDMWDAHKDMALASLGALIAMSITAFVNWRTKRDFAREWVESLRVKIHEPLGEESLARRRRSRSSIGVFVAALTILAGSDALATTALSGIGMATANAESIDPSLIRVSENSDPVSVPDGAPGDRHGELAHGEAAIVRRQPPVHERREACRDESRA
jgi:hypothetical protein